MDGMLSRGEGGIIPVKASILFPSFFSYLCHVASHSFSRSTRWSNGEPARSRPWQ